MSEKEHRSVDDVDLDILGILSENSKQNFKQISDELKKSPVTIKKHIEGLENRGIIKNYGVTIDYEKLGFNIIALIADPFHTFPATYMLFIESIAISYPHSIPPSPQVTFHL